jgi:glucose/arabinose dehydrogenase
VRVLGVAALLGVMPTCGIAQSVPAGFQVDTLLNNGLPQPLDFVFLADGRVLIANRAGELQVYAGGPPALVGTVPSVQTGGESGLLSIEVDPSFAQTGYFYVYYSSSADAFKRLDRFALVGDLSDPSSTNLSLDLSSRRAILDSLPDNTLFHNGGTIRLGPDGMLYLTVGDDGSMCDPQDPASGKGSLFRMDVSGLPAGGGLVAPAFSLLDPGDNPLSTNADISQLVIAHGLRQPFRMEIDSVTGNLYVGDVGGSATEEVNEYLYLSGGLPLRNYGWPWFEGVAPRAINCAGSGPTGANAPIATGSHSAGWKALIQGPRYRNQGGPFDFGASYEGSVFYLDYISGWLRRLEYASGWGSAQPVAGQPTTQDWGTSFVRVTAMKQGPDGAIYWTKAPSGPTAGGKFGRVRPSVLSSTVTYGLGCGNPPLDLSGSSPPIIGTTGQVVLSHAPTTFAFIAIGFSNTILGAATLPVSLAGIGMPGCLLLQSAEVGGLVMTPTGPGTAQYDWPLPNLGGLIGQRVYLQGWALAPAYNAIGVIVSNGVEWRIGNM